MLSKNGVFQTSIPSEGAFLWKLGWQLTTGFEFWLKYRLNYSLLMRHEHVNTAYEIEEILGYLFNEVKCEVFGPSKDILLYSYYECKNPIIYRCSKFIKEEGI